MRGLWSGGGEAYIMQSIFSPAGRRETARVSAAVERRGGELKMLCINVRKH